MSPLGPVNSALSALPLVRTEGSPALGPDLAALPSGGQGGFSQMLDGLASSVGAKEAQASELTIFVSAQRGLWKTTGARWLSASAL